jgi:hypothetical protein
VFYDDNGRPGRRDLAYYLDFGNWRPAQGGRLCISVQGADFVVYPQGTGWHWWMTWPGGRAMSDHAKPFRNRDDAQQGAWPKWCDVRDARQA